MQILFSSSIGSGLGLGAVLLASWALPASEFMLAYYWQIGANIAFAVAETGSIWSTYRRQPFSERIILNRSLWIPMALSGLAFAFAAHGTTDLGKGAVIALITALGFHRYLCHMTELRRHRDYVRAQFMAATTSCLRFVTTCLAVALSVWVAPHLPLFQQGSLLSPGTVLALGVALAYLISPYVAPKARTTKEVASSESPGVGVQVLATACLAVAVLLGRSLVSSASLITEEQWRPFMTVVATAVTVAGNILMSTLLDHSSSFNVSRSRQIALVGCTLILVLLLPDLFHGENALVQAVRLGLCCGAIAVLTFFSLVFGSWYRSSPRMISMLCLGSLAYWLVLSNQSLGGLASFSIAALFSVIYLSAAFPKIEESQRVPLNSFRPTS